MNASAVLRFLQSAEAPDGGGKIFQVGTTVPSDAATGYSPGCIFIKSDGSAGATFYVNEGSLTSADFDPIPNLQGFLPLAGGTLDDAANIALGTTTGTKIGTGTTQKLGFWNATPVVQPGHIADPSITAAALTEASGAIGGTSDGDLTALVDPAGDAGASVIAGIREVATGHNELVVDVTALKASIDLILADLAELGFQAAS